MPGIDGQRTGNAIKWSLVSEITWERYRYAHAAKNSTDAVHATVTRSNVKCCVTRAQGRPKSMDSAGAISTGSSDSDEEQEEEEDDEEEEDGDVMQTMVWAAMLIKARQIYGLCCEL